MKPTTMVWGLFRAGGRGGQQAGLGAAASANSCLFPDPGTGTLTKFTLVLYGTAPKGLPAPPESSGCKTLTSSQACVGQ